MFIGHIHNHKKNKQLKFQKIVGIDSEESVLREAIPVSKNSTQPFGQDVDQRLECMLQFNLDQSQT